MRNYHAKRLIFKAIERHLDNTPLSCSSIGKGAVGAVYKVKLKNPPYIIAVKTVKEKELMIQESAGLNYINARVNIRLPEVLFTHIADQEIPLNIMGMSYIDGKCAARICWRLVSKNKKAAFKRQAIDNLLQLRAVTNDRYGYVNNADYSDWIDFYSDFAESRLKYLNTLQSNGNTETYVKNTLLRAFSRLRDILKDCGAPTLIHGDYWLPNMIADKKTKEFVGCVDPFNLMYADSEYELFALMQFGSVGLYEEYKSRIATSKFCDLKSRMYALFSEVYWCELKARTSLPEYMSDMAKQLEYELNKAKLQ